MQGLNGCIAGFARRFLRCRAFRDLDCPDLLERDDEQTFPFRIRNRLDDQVDGLVLPAHLDAERLVQDPRTGCGSLLERGAHGWP